MAEMEHPVARRRYAGRPLLRLLDSYVLALTGNLDPDTEAKVARVVDAMFGGGPDWKATLRTAVNLPADMDSRIEDLWRSQPKGFDPYAFTVAVSDENFLPLIDPE